MDRRTQFDSSTLRGSKQLSKYAHATLGSGDLGSAVRLPEGEDLSEWLAVHVVDFYNESTLLYGLVEAADTAERFPTMNAGPKYEFRWADSKDPVPVSLPAPEYVERLYGWIEAQLRDERIFPTSPDVQFPSDFKKRVERIFRRLFRVYAHIYHAHFDLIVEQKAQAHLNSCFKHFIYFVKEFGLIQDRDLAPMADYIDEMLKTGVSYRASNGVPDADASGGAAQTRGAEGTAGARASMAPPADTNKCCVVS